MSHLPLYESLLSFSASDLQPLLSALASLVLVTVIVSLVASLATDSDRWVAWPVQIFDKVQGMVAVGISALLGRASLGKVEWGRVSERSPANGGNGTGDRRKVVRRYKETTQGKERAEGGAAPHSRLLAELNVRAHLLTFLPSRSSRPTLSRVAECGRQPLFLECDATGETRHAVCRERAD